MRLSPLTVRPPSPVADDAATHAYSLQLLARVNGKALESGELLSRISGSARWCLPHLQTGL